jgi:hypothetical protein
MAFFQFFKDYKIQIPENTPGGGTLEFTVPSDKELIIEFASGSGNTPSGQISFVVFQLISPSTTTGGTDSITGSYFIPVQKVGSYSPSSDVFVFAQSMRVHVDSGIKVHITIPAGTSQGDFTMKGNFTMTGQLLDAGSSGTSVNF